MATAFAVLLTVDGSELDVGLTVESVVAQDYPNFQLHIIDSGSESGTNSRAQAAYANDSRVRIHGPADGLDQVGLLNQVLDEITADFFLILPAGDQLSPSSLGVVNHYLSVSDDDIDYVYSDHDEIQSNGRFANATYLPDWSPERLRSIFFSERASFFRTKLVRELGGFRSGFDGAILYDLALRVTEGANRALHIPAVLWHVQQRVGVGVGGEASRRAIQDHCDRIGLRAEVKKLPRPGTYRLHRKIDGRPLVSIVIPTGGSTRRIWGKDRVLVLDALQSLVETSTYQHLEVIVVADRATPTIVVDFIRQIVGVKITLIWFDESFNFSKKCNLGAAHAVGDYLLLLNDDIEVISPDWVETMLGLAQGNGVGMVGVKLLLADGTLQHAGQFMGDSRPHHAFHLYPSDFPGPGGMLQIERECSGVTAACAMIPTRVWNEVGGLSELLPNNYNDVDLSLKVRHRGYRICWTPHAILYHFESQSRVSTVTEEEMHFLQVRWDQQLRVDPYGNPNLDGTSPNWVPR